MAYPLRFPEKAPKGTKQGAKLPEVSKQGRKIGVLLAFPRVPSRIMRIEQDLRRRVRYPTELLRRIELFRATPMNMRLESALCFFKTTADVLSSIPGVGRFLYTGCSLL